MGVRLEREIPDWLETPDRLMSNLDDQVAQAARVLDLPADLAANWRNLPPAKVPPMPPGMDAQAHAEAVGSFDDENDGDDREEAAPDTAPAHRPGPDDLDFDAAPLPRSG